MLAPIMQVPRELIERLQAEATSRAEAALMERRAQCDKQVQLARVRVAELEERVRRAEADGDEMSARLTMVELEKAEAEKARDKAQARLAKGSSAEGARLEELEAEVGRLTEENSQLGELKRIVVVLANELKKRLGQEGATDPVRIEAAVEGKCLDEVVNSVEDTDYMADSLSGSDSD